MSNARAARLVRHGEPLQVMDVDLRAPGEGEELITLAYAGVNPVDRYGALGTVAPDGPVPRTLGGEASGWTADGQLVVAVGSGLGAMRDGLYATHAVVPRAAIVPVPAGVSPDVAGAVGIAGLTAYNVARLSEAAVGDTVVVFGAAGGVGLPLVSYVSSLGARVVGQVGSAAKADAVRTAGASDVVVADAESVRDALGGLDGGEFEPTVVIDPLGDGFLRAAIDVLGQHGRYVSFGTSAGAEVTLNWQRMYRKGLRMTGYAGLVLSAAERREGLVETLAAVARGAMVIPIERTYPLDEVNDAFAALADRKVTGKVVLDLQAAR